MTPGAGSSGAVIDVVGLSPATVRSLREHPPSDDDWPALLHVSIAGADPSNLPAVAGRYEVTNGGIRFTPGYPFDPGRPYRVMFDPSHLPAHVARTPIDTTVSTPAVAGQPSARVTGVYPSGDVFPENTLRMYIFFSAPMDRARREAIRLLDAAGRPVDNPFLPLDVGLWNQDHTRFTVLFDPGRVKKGVLPNEQLGRSIVRGQTYTLEIDRDWRDAHGEPLVETYRRQFRVGDPIEMAIDPSRWHLEPPARAGTRDPLVVSFPWPLDYALMQRAIGVRDAHGSPLAGEITVEGGERRWRFAPERPWTSGSYQLAAQSVLEDPSGNRIGRPFELVNSAPAPVAENSKPTTIPFQIARPPQ
jgi:hypothetical protein